MKQYIVLGLLLLPGFIQAQQNEGCGFDSYDSAETGQDSGNQEKKATPSKDAEGVDAIKGESQEADKREENKEEPKSPHTFTSNVSIVSDYRFRGISQTMRRPAIQGGFDYSHAKGVYLGTWASNADGTTHYYNNTSMEWDFYCGYKGKLFPCAIPDFTYNLGLIYYYYPGGKSNAECSVRYNSGEFYVELAYKWLTIKYSQMLTDYFGFNSDNTPFNWKTGLSDCPNGSSRGSIYIEANATFDLLKKVCLGFLKGGKLNLFLHVGHQTIRHYEHLSYTDWRATLTQEFDWFNVFVSYVGTNGKGAYYDVPDNTFHPSIRDLGAQGVVVGVIRTF